MSETEMEKKGKIGQRRPRGCTSTYQNDTFRSSKRLRNQGNIDYSGSETLEDSKPDSTRKLKFGKEYYVQPYFPLLPGHRVEKVWYRTEGALASCSSTKDDPLDHFGSREGRMESSLVPAQGSV
uniref:Ovule protein n=1 Tax=Haemonchus contortus TaxID=6289 RepID=A0A7I5E9G5_HAECO